jgi:hypothetical protein
MLRAYRRALVGKRPFKPVVSDELSGNQLWNQDCVIAESIISFFEHNPYGAEQLLFCSANIKDFARWDKDNDAHILHEDIANDLRCNVTYFRYLPELLAAEFQAWMQMPNRARGGNAVHFRQYQILEQHIRLNCAAHLHRFFACVCLTDQLQIVAVLQERRKSAAHHFVVVHDHDSNPMCARHV